jgi:hypothetical protein
MTSAHLLSEITVIFNKKQQFSNNSISVDTLMLALRIQEQELKPLIEELQMSRDIYFEPHDSTRLAHNSFRFGKITLAN